MRDKQFYIIGIIILLLLTTILAGCQSWAKRPDPIPKNHTQLLLRTVEKTNWMVTISILGIAACTFAFLNGNKWGLTGIVACIIILSMSLMVIRYATWLAIGGLIGAIALVVWSIFIKNRALQQIIQSVQDIKFEKPNEINQHDYVEQQCKHAQSKSTEKLVKKVKGDKKCW